MSWKLIALKDFREARRSAALYVVIGIFVLFSLAMAFTYTSYANYTLSTGGSIAEPDVRYQLYAGLTIVGSVFTGVAAATLCYKSIAGEVESGSAKVLLSLPHSRGEVLAGKFLGRAATLVLAASIGLAAALAVLVFTFPEGLEPVRFGLFVGLTLLNTVAYAALMVGVSASTTTGARAVAGTVGAFFTIEIVWKWIPPFLLGVADVPPGPAPDWIAFVAFLVPSSAYLNAARSLVPGAPTVIVRVAEPRPFYLEGWFSVGVMVLWLVIPLAVGYWRFRRTDL